MGRSAMAKRPNFREARARLLRDRAPLTRGSVCLAVSLVLHGLLVYLLAPFWGAAISWNRDAFDVDPNELQDNAAPTVRFEIAAPSVVSELISSRDLPLLQAPEGTPPEAAPMDVTATVPRAPQITAPWAGRQLALDLLPNTRQAADQTVSTQASRPVPTAILAGGGFEGRAADARGKLVSQRGGTPRSEAAVESGLAWIAAHQHPDGGWRFSHRGGLCDGRCRNSGSEPSTTAATALALLPLLGAGHTPSDGQHAEAVSRGIDYLRGRLIVTPRGGDLQEGTTYGQGLAAIALCEAYAMTHDPSLQEPAQQAIDFIAHTQHVRGGWRYYPGQPGDTTVLGWQWMALRSGQLAGLAVPRETLDRAGAFLDSVQSDDGSAYGYQSSGIQRSPTAIGLLCRMVSGWRRGDPRLLHGIERIVAWGPSYDDMYFNYYATQVLHHQEGPAWAAWNERLREHIIATQATGGHEAGSWHFADPHTTPGGRLCDTALSLMILEVYYRHLPLYGLTAIDF